ncbi:MAG: DUF4854 domain-containing protein [Bacillota bacterium]|nr:DUF4854 domain-containing protein [Bacillota bacterium]
MKKRSIIAVVLSVMLLFAFCGCGGGLTLESYFNDNPDQKAELLEAFEGSDDSGVINMSADISGNTLTVIGTYVDTYPEEVFGVMQEYFDENIDTYEDLINQEKEDLADATGVPKEDITVKVSYVNGDGTEIWSKSY